MFCYTKALYLPAVILLASWSSLVGASLAQETEWKEVDIRADWKRPGYEGQAEYRCWVLIPSDWEGKELSIFLEGADDARRCSVGGGVVATQGVFPPAYRSGLGETKRYPIESDSLRFGELNQITIRVYRRASRENFNVAAPAIFAGDESAIHLSGQWARVNGQFAESFAITDEARKAFVFDRVEDAETVANAWQRLSGEVGPRSPQESLAAMTTADGLQVELALAEPDIGQPLSLKFDERGRMWVVEYLQYPEPAGLKMVSRDKFLRSVYDKVPPPPPHHFRGADRISIHEDRDRDGYFETHKTFVDELNMVSSFAIGRGGVFVLNPPYLLFYPDADHDDVPDGDPEVLLEGFGLEDSHSITNSLRWGPDGWLYATQGSTVSGNVRHYGSDEPPHHTLGQLVWRYHPETKKYEVFAEGGGNAFGLELDKVGRIYSGHNGGDTRGFHYVQGGYFQKSFGKHGALSNPFTFGYFSWMKHHSAQRFSHTFVIDEGGALPEPYQGRLFAVEPLQSRVMMSNIEPDGSTFKTTDVEHALNSEDVWFRPVDIQAGPDGALYIADFYEQRIDHSSHYQGRVHKSSGRIYRLAADDRRLESFDLADVDTEALAAGLHNPNRWIRQTALRVLADRQDQAIDKDFWLDRLKIDQTDGAVGWLWAMNLTGAITPEQWLTVLAHENPHVRRWAVRLLCDQGPPENQDVIERLIDLASTEQNLEVCSQLASSARHLNQSIVTPELGRTTIGLNMASNLAKREQIMDDPHIPLLVWWIFESQANDSMVMMPRLIGDGLYDDDTFAQQFLLPRIMRRFAATGRRSDLENCASLLLAAENPTVAQALLRGFDEAFKGQLMLNLPPMLVEALAKHRGESLEWKLQQGDLSVLGELHDQIIQSDDAAKRIAWLELLGKIGDPSSISTIRKLASQDSPSDVQAAAYRALRGYSEDDIASHAIERYGSAPGAERLLIEGLVASRPSWTLQFLNAVEEGSIESGDVDPQTIDQMSFHSNRGVGEAIARIWGARETTSQEELDRRIEHLQEVLSVGSGNPYQGRTLYTEHCGRCHKLFAKGGDVGPDLTSYQRTDPYRMLANVLSPSLEIREGFETHVALTIDGLTVSGFIADRDPRQVTIRQADGQAIVIPEDEIEELTAVPKSVMPEGLLDELTDEELRNLFAYLRSTLPLPN